MGFSNGIFKQVRQGLPIPVNFREKEALELDDFPEYIVDLTPHQKDMIEALALAIVKSNDTRDPIFEFRVEGHADIARRISDPNERKKFEDEISIDRAEHGFDALAAALKLKGGEALANRITKGSTAFGLGTQRLKVPNATTEAQFRLNRRVVFYIRQVTFIPPPPAPTPPPSSVIEDRYSVQLIKGAVLTVTLADAIESVSALVTLRITDHIEKKTADFVATATGVGVGGGPFPLGGSINFDPGPEVFFKTFRFTDSRSDVDLSSFVGPVTIFSDANTGIGPLSAGGTLSFVFDALPDHGINTQPQVIRVPSGSSSFSVPGASAPEALPIGRLTMKGSPSSF